MRDNRETAHLAAHFGVSVDGHGAGVHSTALVSPLGDRGSGGLVTEPEESRGSTGQDAGGSQVGATSRTVQQKADRRWPTGSLGGTGEGERVR